VSATPALLVAAGGVGFGHAILPDHWVPLAVIGRTQRYPLAKVARLSGLAGLAHVLVSIALGAVIIVIGLQFRSSIEHAQNAIIGSLLIATGIGFLLVELTGHGHAHEHEPGHEDEPGRGHRHRHGHEDGHRHGHGHEDEDEPGPGHGHGHAESPSRLASAAKIMVPFGAAASPDLTILPVFLAATAAGAGAAVGSVFVFAAVTIGTIVGLTLFATVGGYQVRGQWLDRWGNLFTAGVLVAIGALVVSGVL
jgi:nickel/cobalt transporter (NicO) family protein